MKVAIFGTGSVALATAALLNKKGLTPLMISLTGLGGKALQVETVQANGAIDGRFSINLAQSAQTALADADHVIVATSADRYASVLQELIRHAESRHHILVSGELSRFGAAIEKKFGARNQYPQITSLASTLVTGRRSEEPAVRVGLIRKSIMAFSQTANCQEDEVAHWNSLLGGQLQRCESPVRLLLSNLNPIVHAPNALGNLTRIENGEEWSNYAGITGGVASLLEALDEERILLGRALGEKLKPFKVQFQKTNAFEPNTPLRDMAKEMSARRGGLPKGPTALTTRYVIEDVPFGLVPIERLAKFHDVETPVTSAIITVFSAIYERQFRLENPFLEFLVADY